LILIAGLIHLLIALRLYFTRRSGLISALLNFSLSTGEEQLRRLWEMPFPYAIVNDRGTVLWKNSAFSEIARKGKNLSGNLLSMFPNITEEMLLREDAMLEIHSSFQGRKYCIDFRRAALVSGESAEQPSFYDGESEVVSVYLRDETDELRLAKELSDERIVCGLVYIDNYEEVLDQIEEVRRSLLTALVDRKINRYISSVNGLIKKIEKDKYFFVI